MRIILSPAVLFRLVDACLHARRAKRVFMVFTERLLDALDACIDDGAVRVELRPGGVVSYDWLNTHREIALFLSADGGFNLRPLDG
jgi:hypothetical protein